NLSARLPPELRDQTHILHRRTPFVDPGRRTTRLVAGGRALAQMTGPGPPARAPLLGRRRRNASPATGRRGTASVRPRSGRRAVNDGLAGLLGIGGGLGGRTLAEPDVLENAVGQEPPAKAGGLCLHEG